MGKKKKGSSVGFAVNELVNVATLGAWGSKTKPKKPKKSK